jgi:transcriptional regulator with XRE-family HTH domain
MNKPAHVVLFENLQFEMAMRHLSQADLAHRSGLSLRGIKEITTAAQSGQAISLDKLERLAAAFDLSAGQLLSPREEPGAAADAQAPGMQVSAAARRAATATPKQLGKLIEDFFALPEADRLVLLDTASAMASKYRMYITS